MSAPNDLPLTPNISMLSHYQGIADALMVTARKIGEGASRSHMILGRGHNCYDFAREAKAKLLSMHKELICSCATFLSEADLEEAHSQFCRRVNGYFADVPMEPEVTAG